MGNDSFGLGIRGKYCHRTHAGLARVGQRRAHEYPGNKLASHEISRLKGSIAWVLGASMIIRSDIMKNLGGFDETFFIYGEDQDLCLRIRKAGYEIGYIDTAIIVHLGAQSERETTTADVWRKKIIAEYTFYRKHYLPATVEKITRGDFMKARWRIMTLSLLIPFYKDKSEAEEKLVKYRITLQTISQIRHDDSQGRI